MRYLTCGGSPLIHRFFKAVNTFLLAFFLSSGVVHATPNPFANLPGSWNTRASGDVSNRRQLHIPPATSAFERHQAPFQRYEVTWPNTSADHSYYEQVMAAVRNPVMTTVHKPIPYWHWGVLAIGAVVLILTAVWWKT